MTRDEIFRRLKLVPCDGLSDEQRTLMEDSGCFSSAGFERDGVNAVELHDAVFKNEDIALAALGSNLERLNASMNSLLSRLGERQSQKIVDIGGGCGVVCFEAAAKFPNSNFMIVDRSKEALRVGRVWADRLDLRNIFFHQLDFFEMAGRLSAEGGFDIAWIDYVFHLEPSDDDGPRLVAEMMPAFSAAKAVIGREAKVCVRFGGFTEIGLQALISVTLQNGLRMTEAYTRESGTDVIFEAGDERDVNVADEYARLETEFDTQAWSES